MRLDCLANIVYQKFENAGLHPFYGASVMRVTIPVLGNVYLDFDKDTVNLSGIEGKGVYKWLCEMVFPHIKTKLNGGVCPALQEFLWRRHSPEDVNVRLGVNHALVLITWDYVKLSSEDIEPEIKEFCETRGWTYDLDIDRFYVNITECSWV